MRVLVFKTNIKSKGKVQRMDPFFSGNSAVLKWTVDTEDEDNVLRVEALSDFQETEVISLVKQSGFHCEVLNY